jgi:hypothetical protein
MQADYAWVYFSLSAPAFQLDKDIYVQGCLIIIMTPEFKMDYNSKKKEFMKSNFNQTGLH